jgi:hypothetical protein
MPPKKDKKIVEIKETPIETLDVLEEKIESDEEIQAPPPTPEVKVKKPRTQAQLEALQKGRDACHARRMVKDLTEKKREALIQKQILIDEKKKAVEDKLIKTAVAVKKKQLVEEARLAKYTKDMEEEIPDEVVRKIIKEKNIPKPVLRREPQIQQIVEPPNPFAKYYFLP